jgi:hypothetical protein
LTCFLSLRNGGRYVSVWPTVSDGISCSMLTRGRQIGRRWMTHKVAIPPLGKKDSPGGRMPNVCRVCRSPNLTEIDKALLSETPLRHVAAQFGTSSSALVRHKAHIVTDLVQAHAAEKRETASTILEEINRLRRKAEEIIDQCEKAPAVALMGIRELRGLLALYASLEIKAREVAIEEARTRAGESTDRTDMLVLIDFIRTYAPEHLGHALQCVQRGKL